MSEFEETDVVRPNVVDGIEEYDNPLPYWWVWLFKGTVAFGFAYLAWVHGYGLSTIDSELQKSQVQFAEEQKSKNASTSSGDFTERSHEPQLVAEGKGIFVSNCAPCHGADGGGTVGPNLTDVYWLHGGAPADVLKVITSGVPEKGMLAWGPILGAAKVEAAAAYVLSLQGTKPATPKEPQGEEYKP